MATMDDRPLFIDTNILVYANVIETPFHEQALATINTAHETSRTLWISCQVIREYLVTLTRPPNDLVKQVITTNDKQRFFAFRR